MKFRTTIAALLLGTATLAGNANAEDLRDALVSVYSKNPRLLAERARLRETDETYVQARAEGRVTLGGTGSISKAWVDIPSGGGVFGAAQGGIGGASDITLSETPNEVGLSVVQPIYQGGRVKALKQQAKLGILAARENLRAQENTLFLTAANAYVDVLRDEETARIRRNNVRVLVRQLEAATTRFDVGQGTRTDVAQSESRMAAAEAGLAQAEAQLEISRAAYVRVVGRKPYELTPPPKFALPTNVLDAIAAARDNNPDLIAAYFAEAAGRANIDVAKAVGRPTLSLAGNLLRQRNQLSTVSSIDSAAITAQVTIPIYSGGATQSRVRQAKHAKTRLAFETRDAEMAVDEAVTQIWAQLTAAKATLNAVERQEASAAVAFEGVTLEQSVGARDQLDVLNSEQELLNAKLAVVDAERNVNAATFNLLAVIGVFDAEGIQLPVETYDKNANFETIRYKGLTEAIDTYVPEFAQRIGRQLPDIATESVGAAQTLYEYSRAQQGVEGLGAIVGTGAEGLKQGVDIVTGLTPEYSDLKDGAPIQIDSEPVIPPSKPRFSPILQDNSDEISDETE